MFIMEGRRPFVGRICASIQTAAPRAVPASPAAGCTHTSSNGPRVSDPCIEHTIQRDAPGQAERPCRVDRAAMRPAPRSTLPGPAEATAPDYSGAAQGAHLAGARAELIGKIDRL